MNRLFASCSVLIAMFFLLVTSEPLYGDNLSIDRFIDICKTTEKLENKVDTLDIQMSKYDRLQRNAENVLKEATDLKINLNNMTQRLGEVSYQLRQLKTGKPSNNKAEQIEKLNAESNHLKREIESSATLLHEKRQAQDDLQPQLTETLNIIDAIAGDNPKAFREQLFAEREKLDMEARGLLNGMTDEEKRFAWRSLGVKEEIIEEMLVQEKMEKGVEFMDRLSAILNKTAPKTAAGGNVTPTGTLAGEPRSGEMATTQNDQETDSSEIPDILRNSQTDSSTDKPRIVSGSASTGNTPDDPTRPPGPDAKIGFSVETEEVEFEGYIYRELINPDRAIVAIAEQGKERELRGAEAVTFLVQRGEFYYLAGVGLVSKHRHPAPGKQETIAKKTTSIPKTGVANAPSCDDLIKQFDLECGQMHGNAVQAYCAKFNYPGCAMDVPSCFSPYFPRQVFAGKACTDGRIRNCLNGTYGGFIGCVRDCNAQAASSGAANLAGCITGCGETIKAGIKSCYEANKP